MNATLNAAVAVAWIIYAFAFLRTARPAPAVPCGAACLLCRLPTLPLACFVAPIPPPALAERSSPPGKGEIFCFLMQGTSPLASPGLNLRGTGRWGRTTRPAGGLPCLLPANRAFSLLSCPHPPARARRALFPGGKGEIFCFLMQGASPLASPRAGRDAALVLLVENRFFRR